MTPWTGGSGDDVIDGGIGNDTVRGGEGGRHTPWPSGF